MNATSPAGSAARRPAIDDLDHRLLTLVAKDPHVGVLGASRELGVARGTVQARLDRLVERGVIESWAPRISPAALGYPVTAFATLEIHQDRGHEAIAHHLQTVPEVIEAHTITGSGDIYARVVARSNADLQRVIDQIVAGGLVARVSTVIALAPRVPYRTSALVEAAAADGTTVPVAGRATAR